MLDAAKAYLSSQYEKVRQLNGANAAARSEVWLVSDAAGRPAVMRVVHAGGMPFALLREHQGTATPFWPEIFFCAEDEDETIVVEEYVSGHTLEERRVARQWLTEAEARSLLAQAAAGLAALHALGIVHRDIKPAHLIVQPGGSGASGSLGAIRLIDFDAARIVTAGAAHDTHRLGTEGYAPPEQFGYGQTDGRSDIYALGVTVRELLGPDFAETSRLGRILARCTEKDPDRRYPDARALAAALQPSRKRTYLRRAAVLSATAVLTLALGGGALLLLTPSGTTPAQELEQTLEDATTTATNEARQVRDAATGKKTAPSANDADDAKTKKSNSINGLPDTNPATDGRRIDSAEMQNATLDLHLTGDTASISGSKDWVVTFYLQNVGGYHVFDELRSQ